MPATERRDRHQREQRQRRSRDDATGGASQRSETQSKPTSLHYIILTREGLTMER